MEVVVDPRCLDVASEDALRAELIILVGLLGRNKLTVDKIDVTFVARIWPEDEDWISIELSVPTGGTKYGDQDFPPAIVGDLLNDEYAEPDWLGWFVKPDGSF
jgi:hypothetical protein